MMRRACISAVDYKIIVMCYVDPHGREDTLSDRAAEYDLETAKVMLSGKRFLYVGFMCHQVVEKALKAYYQFFRENTPPHIHNLSVLGKPRRLVWELG